MRSAHASRTEAAGVIVARALALATFACASALPGAALADDLLVYQLVARDGVFEPKTIEVPAGKRFKIEISNDGKTPMEFESRVLKQEKVLASGAKSSVVINPLKPGTYPFFDDYHPDTSTGQVVVK